MIPSHHCWENKKDSTLIHSEHLKGKDLHTAINLGLFQTTCLLNIYPELFAERLRFNDYSFGFVYGDISWCCVKASIFPVGWYLHFGSFLQCSSCPSHFFPHSSSLFCNTYIFLSGLPRASACPFSPLSFNLLNACLHMDGIQCCTMTSKHFSWLGETIPLLLPLHAEKGISLGIHFQQKRLLKKVSFSLLLPLALASMAV